MAHLKLVGTLCLATVLVSCGHLAEQSEFDRSSTTWRALKAEHGDHYRYAVDASSVFGPLTVTTLTVKDEAVVVRTYEVSEVTGAGVNVVESWTEEGAAVGSHEEGAEPLTLDERYHSCQDGVLNQSRAANDIYLTFQDNGVLASCFSLPRGAVYDGGAEVITDLEFLSSQDP